MWVHNWILIDQHEKVCRTHLTIKSVAEYPALLLSYDCMTRVINIYKRPCLTLLAERSGDDDGEDDSRVQRISTRLMQGAI